MREKSQRQNCSASLFFYKKTSCAEKWRKLKPKNAHLFDRTKFWICHAKKRCRSATVHNWTGDWISRYTLYNTVGETPAQSSVIRFQSSSILDGEVVYTLPVMNLHRKMSNGFRSNDDDNSLANYHTRCLVFGIYPKDTVSYLILCTEGPQFLLET